MFHCVGPYIFDRLITSLSCHTSVYVMHLSKKKDLRSWLKGSLSWSKSECETVRPCILCTSCLPRNILTFKPRISYALTWSECLRLPSKDHDPESVGTLLDGRIELLKSNKTSEFLHAFFFAQLPCEILCFLTALKRNWVHHVITCKHNGNVIGADRKLSVESCTYFDLFYWKLTTPEKDRKGVPTHTEAIAWSSPS